MGVSVFGFVAKAVADNALWNRLEIFAWAWKGGAAMLGIFPKEMTMHGRTSRLAAVVAASAAIIATLASSVVGGTVSATYPDIMGCESGCMVAAGGWPVPYLVDYPGISPVGSVALTDALLGIDTIRPAGLAATFVFWLAASALAVWLPVRARRRQTSSSAR
jgi:hypothetical protein